MSIILKGIDLPKGKDEAISLLIISDGTVAEEINSDRYGEMTNVEAIQIPKGAKLINANDIYMGRWDIDTDLADQILNAPSILESEEEK